MEEGWRKKGFGSVRVQVGTVMRSKQVSRNWEAQTASELEGSGRREADEQGRR